MGISAKALIFKALGTLKTRYQQSYPQKLWMQDNLFMNQRLKSDFASSHQLEAATWMSA
jgi:hypothetical protein